MRRWLALCFVPLLLCGCAGSDSALDRGMALREKMLVSGCGFTAHITADYGDVTYTFSLACAADTEGSVSFTVLSPETIRDISGVLSAKGGKLTFDDKALAFEMLADGELSPVSAPWLLVRTLQSGYLSSCSVDNGKVRMSMDDSYREDALQLEVWLNEGDMPSGAEFVWQGRKVLSMIVEDFSFV